MEATQIILQGTTPKELLSRMEFIFQKVLNETRPTDKEGKEIVSPKILRERLEIGKTTEWKWRKSGKIPAKGIGNRVYYVWEEVIESLENIK